MRRTAFVTLSCLVLTTGCAAPLGMAAASLAGSAVTEAGAKLGREASARLSLWLDGDDAPPSPAEEACRDDPDADGCEPELLLAAYLKRASPERREQILTALPPDLRGQMEAALAEDGGSPAAVAAPASAYDVAPAAGPQDPAAAPPPTPLFNPFAAGVR